MTPNQFISKWTGRGFGERQAAQTWFRDLLHLVGHPDPIEYNDRDNLAFENPVPSGFAHGNLDNNVSDTYGWPSDLPDHQILENPLALNQHRDAQESTK